MNIKLKLVSLQWYVLNLSIIILLTYSYYIFISLSIETLCKFSFMTDNKTEKVHPLPQERPEHVSV